MVDLTPGSMELFRRYHGHATGPMLTQVGVGRRRRDRLVEAGVLDMPFPRVYRLTSSTESLESRCTALCLAHPQGFITGTSAGRLMNLRRMGRSALLVFAVPHGSNIGPLAGVVLRQTTRIDPDHVRTRHDGIRLAAPARLAFDLGIELPVTDQASVIEQLLHDRHCTVADLGRMARRLGHPSRPGSAQFLMVLHSRIEGGPLESHLEVQLARALRERGIPVVAQVDRLQLPNGKQVRLDLAVPAIRWGIEIDGHPEHFMLEGGTSDRRRDRQCHLIGWQVERVSPLDMADLPGLCDELEALYRERVRAVA
jgi:hypothetical protein